MKYAHTPDALDNERLDCNYIYFALIEQDSSAFGFNINRSM